MKNMRCPVKLLMKVNIVLMSFFTLLPCNFTSPFMQSPLEYGDNSSMIAGCNFQVASLITNSPELLINTNVEWRIGNTAKTTSVRYFTSVETVNITILLLQYLPVIYPAL
jgi:hypothetical protein